MIKKWSKITIFSKKKCQKWKSRFSATFGLTCENMPWESFCNTRFHWEMSKIDPECQMTLNHPKKPVKMSFWTFLTPLKIMFLTISQKWPKITFLVIFWCILGLEMTPLTDVHFLKKGSKSDPKKCHFAPKSWFSRLFNNDGKTHEIWRSFWALRCSLGQITTFWWLDAIFMMNSWVIWGFLHDLQNMIFQFTTRIADQKVTLWLDYDTPKYAQKSQKAPKMTFLCKVLKGGQNPFLTKSRHFCVISQWNLVLENDIIWWLRSPPIYIQIKSDQKGSNWHGFAQTPLTYPHTNSFQLAGREKWHPGSCGGTLPEGVSVWYHGGSYGHTLEEGHIDG